MKTKHLTNDIKDCIRALTLGTYKVWSNIGTVIISPLLPLSPLSPLPPHPLPPSHLSPPPIQDFTYGHLRHGEVCLDSLGRVSMQPPELRPCDPDKARVAGTQVGHVMFMW